MGRSLLETLAVLAVVTLIVLAVYLTHLGRAFTARPWLFWPMAALAVAAVCAWRLKTGEFQGAATILLALGMVAYAFCGWAGGAQSRATPNEATPWDRRSLLTSILLVAFAIWESARFPAPRRTARDIAVEVLLVLPGVGGLAAILIL